MMWLSEIKGLTRKNILTLINEFEYPENIWKAGITELSKLIGEEKAALIKKSKNIPSLKNRASYLEKNNIEYISIQNKKYPYLLKNIFDPPLGLYIKGNLPSDDNLFISVIGSRNCTEYGAKAARRFSFELARNGAVVVSGMAEGIDSIANKWAIEAGGKTVAVLGTGINVCYPESKRELMEEIAEKGCVVTEFPLGTRPSRWTFPKRNRIISGLSKGILLVEAGRRSGTRSTIDFALENGREVFAVPGDIFNEAYAGSNELLLNGAHIAINPENILEYFNGIKECIPAKKEASLKTSYNTVDTVKKYEAIPKKNTEKESAEEETIKNFIYYEGLSENEKKILSLMNENPVNIEYITANSDIPVYEIQVVITSLEIKGIIKEISGNRYEKV